MLVMFSSRVILELLFVRPLLLYLFFRLSSCVILWLSPTMRDKHGDACWRDKACTSAVVHSVQRNRALSDPFP